MVTESCLCGLWPLGGDSGVIDMPLGVGSLVFGSNASLTSGAEFPFTGGRGGCAPPRSFACDEAVDGRVRSFRVGGGP